MLARVHGLGWWSREEWEDTDSRVPGAPGDLLVQQPLLLEDAVYFRRSLRSLELLPVQHLLLQFFNGLKNKG